MTSRRRLAIFVAGAVATISLVAVGPGDIALGANPNDSKDNGNRGANSPGSGPGAPGRDVNDRGRSGRTGKPGQDGEAGDSLGRRNGLDGVEIDIPGGRGLGPQRGLRGRLTRQAQRQVRNALADAGI